MIIDCIGCLHGYYPKLEGGDFLIVTGDLTASHTEKEWHEFATWLNKQDYEKIVFIAGNHDTMIEKWDKEQDAEGYKDPISDPNDRIEYLCDSGTEFEGFKIWGSPWSAWFEGINPKCTAFTYKDPTKHYDDHIINIPKGIDILITHEPVYGILDGIPQEDGSLFHIGSKALLGWLKYVERPKLHVFSHIHEGYGKVAEFPTYDDKMMISVNCSIMNEKYKPVNKPIRIIL